MPGLFKVAAAPPPGSNGTDATPRRFMTLRGFGRAAPTPRVAPSPAQAGKNGAAVGHLSPNGRMMISPDGVRTGRRPSYPGSDGSGPVTGGSGPVARAGRRPSLPGSEASSGGQWAHARVGSGGRRPSLPRSETSTTSSRLGDASNPPISRTASTGSIANAAAAAAAQTPHLIRRPSYTIGLDGEPVRRARRPSFFGFDKDETGSEAEAEITRHHPRGRTPPPMPPCIWAGQRASAVQTATAIDKLRKRNSDLQQQIDKRDADFDKEVRGKMMRDALEERVIGLSDAVRFAHTNPHCTARVHLRKSRCRVSRSWRTRSSRSRSSSIRSRPNASSVADTDHDAPLRIPAPALSLRGCSRCVPPPRTLGGREHYPARITRSRACCSWPHEFA